MNARPSSDSVGNLLIEIGTEELPAKSLLRLGQNFAVRCQKGLADAGLLQDPSLGYRWFATPRRLAVWIGAVRKKQPDQQIMRRGPALVAAFDQSGQPTAAALGFARSCGIDIAQLSRSKTDKGEWLVHRVTKRGRNASTLIPQCIDEAVKRLPISKRMRWGDGMAEFVRPVHWLVILHDKQPVSARLMSVEADIYTHGHRFHCNRRLRLTSPDRYEEILRGQGFVIPDFMERRQRIVKQVRRLARRVEGEAIMDVDLLNEVTGLVEWPQSVLGAFDKAFLKVPSEALISSMRDHQKYFPIKDARGRLLPHFITVNNIKSKRPKQIRAGNERVLHARLSDARFFWDTDRGASLSSRIDSLKQILFHSKLGSVHAKVLRLQTLSATVGDLLNTDVSNCKRAALLSKADLVTEMVNEFPELQGVMGRYYAKHDGEHPDVAAALEEHYRPRYSGDRLPRHAVGQAVAVADRIDTLVGIFAAGEEPSGDKDPYGLRRAAIGVLRILIEKRRNLDLKLLLQASARIYSTQPEPVAVSGAVVDRVFDFLLERLRAYYADDGYRMDDFNAVLATRPSSPLDFDKRLRAVARFRKLPQAEYLSEANKRIRNILRRAEDNEISTVDAGLLRERAEQNLLKTLTELTESVGTQFLSGEYNRGLKRLASLKQPIDRFFDQVLVMDEDPGLRRNRLALLRQVEDLFLRVADISQLNIEKQSKRVKS